MHRNSNVNAAFEYKVGPHTCVTRLFKTLQLTSYFEQYNFVTKAIFYVQSNLS